MAEKLHIVGGQKLTGEITIQGAKNAALPLLCAGLMTDEVLTLTNMPDLSDTRLMARLLENHGLAISFEDNVINLAGAATNFDAPYELVSAMRASVLVLGPLLARYGEARVSLPGGCAIGSRPVDLHIKAMQSLGAIVELADGYIQARAPQGLKGGRIVFSNVSVGATENAMMAACLAKGQTKLINAAREPEIIDLGDCLNAMGAKVTGHGTDTIVIEGVGALHGADHDVIPDRIEAGSFMIGAAMTGGELRLKKARADHLDALIEVLKEVGVSITSGADWIAVKANGPLRSVDVETAPYPAFPTDLQAQYMALMCMSDGYARISETIFENRFMHVPELMRMGADIVVDGGLAIVKGKGALKGAPVRATDLRASISLVLAAMCAIGETSISEIHHLDRGYAALEDRLRGCGAIVTRLAS
ncbi:MAG: UDP-N-acetylglucosamine 1-carboxyvinyltransferase [Candidatus Puniceispirillaceae bacterium]